MDIESSSKSHTPIFLLGLALFSVVMGIFLSPDLLISLGPMRTSLTSDIELVKQSAYLEVTLIKYFFHICGFLFLALVIFWKRIVQIPYVKMIQALPDPGGSFSKGQKLMTNPAFLLMATLAALSLAFLTIAPNFLNKKNLILIAGEDGIYENATALMFLVAAWYSGQSVRALHPSRRKILSLFLCLFFTVCIGEEISWGQRFLNTKTPDEIMEFNVQGETNIHNMFGYAADHLFIAGVIVGGFLLPFLASFYPFLRKFCWVTGIPLASGGLALGFLIASLFHSWVLSPIAPPSIARPAEIREFLSAVGFVLIMREHFKSA